MEMINSKCLIINCVFICIEYQGYLLFVIHLRWLLYVPLVEDCFHLLMYYCCCLIDDGFTGLILCYCLVFWEILKLHQLFRWLSHVIGFDQRVLCCGGVELFAWGRLVRFWNCQFYVGLVVELDQCTVGFERRRSLPGQLDVDLRGVESRNCRCSLRASPGFRDDSAWYVPQRGRFLYFDPCYWDFEVLKVLKHSVDSCFLDDHQDDICFSHSNLNFLLDHHLLDHQHWCSAQLPMVAAHPAERFCAVGWDNTRD